MKMNRINHDDVDDFSYCDCNCICEKSEEDNCLCGCDCDCVSVKLVTGNQIKKFITTVPHIPIKLPRKAGSKEIPNDTPIKVKVPRSHICHNTPNGPLQTVICEPEILNPKCVKHGVINVCVLILPGAKVGRMEKSSEIPSRVRTDFEAANSIWRQDMNGGKQGVTFKVTNIHFVNSGLKGIGENVQDFPWKKEQIEDLFLSEGKRLFPSADVYIFYMNGQHIGPTLSNGARTVAITFRNFPVIIMSNGAKVNQYILAHELGHFMYLNNLMEYSFDPHPFPLDPDHNVDPSNIMYPTSDYWPSHSKPPTITPAQIRKALNARFFYQNEK
ncbi:hypothetical protein [Pseudoneobacillus sp. C159]